MYARCAACSRIVAAPLASAPDGPTHTATGHPRRSGSRGRRSSMSASIAPVDFTCRISSVDRCAFASSIASRIERHVRRVEVALDLHDVDAALADRRGRRARERVEREHRRRDDDRDATTATTRTCASGDIRRAMGTPVASVAMDLERFCAASRVVIVAGKGGVGKTTVTAALATAAARTGMSVLIVEVEGKSGLAACFGEPPLTYEEAELRPRAPGPDPHPRRRPARVPRRPRYATDLEAAHCESGALDVVATAVPGMKDILVLGKVKQLEQARRRRPDRARRARRRARGHLPPVGPRACSTRCGSGPIQKQAADVVELLTDPTRCQVLLVTLPEETPVNELVDTAFAVEDRAGVALGPVVVNQCVPPLDARRRRGRPTPPSAGARRSTRPTTRCAARRRDASAPTSSADRTSSARGSPSGSRSRRSGCPSSSPPTSDPPRSSCSPTSSSLGIGAMRRRRPR